MPIFMRRPREPGRGARKVTPLPGSRGHYSNEGYCPGHFLSDPIETPDESVSFHISEAQINQGLWYLVSNSCSDHMFALLDTRVSWPERKRCLFAIFTLFERFFAPRCSTHLSHLDTLESNTGHVSPLNLICYMWWDILPLSAQLQVPGGQEIEAACLEVMRLTLDLEADACRESALHGLGHWAHAYRQQVETTINAWLARHQELEEELKAYAFAARRGRVLFARELLLRSVQERQQMLQGWHWN